MVLKYKIIRNTILQSQNHPISQPFFIAVFYFLQTSHRYVFQIFYKLKVLDVARLLFENFQGEILSSVWQKLYNICCLYDAFEAFPAADSSFQVLITLMWVLSSNHTDPQHGFLRMWVHCFQCWLLVPFLADLEGLAVDAAIAE